MAVLMFDSRQTISGLNQAVNTWHCLVPGQPLVSECNAILAPFKTFWDSIAAYRNSSTSVQTGSRVLYFLESWWTKPVGRPGAAGYVKGFFNTPPVIVAATPSNSINGTGGSPVPQQLASVISWRTSTSGRSGRGRTYLGNLAAAAQSGPVITAAFVTAVNSGCTTLISSVGALPVAPGGNAKLGVWSPTVGVCREILTGSTDATWDTMRSRVK
jgi:hypothetical protein